LGLPVFFVSQSEVEIRAGIVWIGLDRTQKTGKQLSEWTGEDSFVIIIPKLNQTKSRHPWKSQTCCKTGAENHGPIDRQPGCQGIIQWQPGYPFQGNPAFL